MNGYGNPFGSSPYGGLLRHTLQRVNRFEQGGFRRGDPFSMGGNLPAGSQEVLGAGGGRPAGQRQGPYDIRFGGFRDAARNRYRRRPLQSRVRGNAPARGY